MHSEYLGVYLDVSQINAVLHLLKKLIPYHLLMVYQWDLMVVFIRIFE